MYISNVGSQYYPVLGPCTSCTASAPRLVVHCVDTALTAAVGDGEGFMCFGIRLMSLVHFFTSKIRKIILLNVPDTTS